jgi:spermidine synthase
VTALATDPYFTQSAIYHDSDEAVLDYSRFYHLAEYYDPNIQNALMIGGAGYTFPREFLRSHPAASIDVVEIDPKMTAIARQFFRLRDDPRMTIIHEDGRAFLNRAREKQYDVVYMDAFNSLFSVPYHLTTIEAVRHIDRVLKDDGVVIFNLGSALTGTASHFLQAEYRTYAEIFPRVEVYKVNFAYSDDRLQNLIVLATKGRPPGSSENAEVIELLSHRYNSPISLDLPILTDDLAPVEHYGSEALDQYRR